MKRLNVDKLKKALSSSSGHRHRDGRVRFFAHREEIRVGLSRGYSLILLYEQYADVFQFSYSQFSRYVSKYLKAPAAELGQSNAVALERQKEAAKPGHADSRQTGLPQFNYRTDTPKDDLI